MTIQFGATSIDLKKVVNQVKNFLGLWFEQFIKYLGKGTLLMNKKKAWEIISKLGNYLLRDSKLYKMTSLRVNLLVATSKASLNIFKEEYKGE